MTAVNRVAAVRKWFSERDFSVTFEEGDGFVWANLTRITSGVVLGRYARGTNHITAAERARQRWIQEEVT